MWCIFTCVVHGMCCSVAPHQDESNAPMKVITLNESDTGVHTFRLGKLQVQLVRDTCSDHTHTPLHQCDTHTHAYAHTHCACCWSGARYDALAPLGAPTCMRALASLET